MHHNQNSIKPVSAGNLAFRAFFICLALLIVPLFIHSFFQYQTEMKLEAAEIQLQEQNTRATLRVVGEQMSRKLEEMIQLDWALIDNKVNIDSLGKRFHTQKIPLPPEVSDHFAVIDENGANLWVGKKNSSSEAIIIAHPLHQILSLNGAPFPIDISLNEALVDPWIERFSIPNTQLTLLIGTKEQLPSHLHKTNFIVRILSFVLIVGLLGGGLVFLLLRKLARPLNVLRLTMARVAEGAVYSRYVSQRFGFEINTIGAFFNDTVDALLVHQKEAEEERIKKEKLEQKLQLAHEIQADLLPKKISATAHLDIGSAFLPALEVGGDFYDVFSLSSGKTLLVLADIADKGMSACLFSLGLRSSLRALAEVCDSLPKLAKKANDLFMLDAAETSQFATVWLGILEGRSLSYVCLGHPPAILKRKGELQELATGHPAMGLLPFDKMQTQTMTLQTGDELLLYSDGVTEAHDSEELLYGSDRLKGIFLKASGHSAADVAHTLLYDVQSFSQNAPQHDDLTLLVIRLI